MTEKIIQALKKEFTDPEEEPLVVLCNGHINYQIEEKELRNEFCAISNKNVYFKKKYKKEKKTVPLEDVIGSNVRYKRKLSKLLLALCVLPIALVGIGMIITSLIGAYLYSGVYEGNIAVASSMGLSLDEAADLIGIEKSYGDDSEQFQKKLYEYGFEDQDDLKSGTSYIYRILDDEQTQLETWILIDIFLLCLLIFDVVQWILFIVQRKKFLEIEYVTGKIRFNVNLYNSEEIQFFRQILHRENVKNLRKDLVREENIENSSDKEMQYENHVLMTQIYSFSNLLKYSFIKEKRLFQQGYGHNICILLILIGLSYGNYGNTIKTLLMTCCIYMLYFVVISVWKILRAYMNTTKRNRYNLNHKDPIIIVEKDNELFIQNGDFFIKLSNCLYHDMVTYIDTKKIFLFEIKYFNLFFTINKREAYYKKIRECFIMPEVHDSDDIVGTYLYKEEVAVTENEERGRKYIRNLINVFFTIITAGIWYFAFMRAKYPFFENKPIQRLLLTALFTVIFIYEITVIIRLTGKILSV